MQSVFVNLMKVQSELIFNLFNIYPIYGDRIRGLILNNSVFNKFDKEEVAVALGYTSHLVLLISQYLYIPIRYPIRLKSSRSSVLDMISVSFQGSREYPELIRFPLYSRGSERMRFEYAVFLLNKDIEQVLFPDQILNAVGAPVRNLRQTLGNVQQIVTRLHKCQPQYSYLIRPNDIQGPANWDYLASQFRTTNSSSIASSQL